VAEAVVMLATALLKQFPAKHAALRHGGWGVPDAGRMVAGATIGMIGLGNVGRAVVRRLAGWDCRLLCADPHVSPADAAIHGVELVDLETLLRSSDVVSVQASLTPATRHLIGGRELALMRPEAYLINTARGPLVDEAALRRALDEGRIAGAALDVWEEEPTPADNPLRTHPRVLGTGHNVGHPRSLYDDMVAAAVDNVLRPLRGEPPLHVRNPEVLPAWRARVAALDEQAAPPC
jgi:phosphoglycerate dehydrogenase-like enzyme